jgi:hypothetical protein
MNTTMPNRNPNRLLCRLCRPVAHGVSHGKESKGETSPGRGETFPLCRRSAAISRATTLREGNSILRDEIDRMVNLFSRSDAEFVAGYRSARVVVDRAATRSTKPVASPPPPVNP